jgi:hypothetical protein
MGVDDLVADLIDQLLGLPGDLDVLELLFDCGVGRQGGSSSSSAPRWSRACLYVCR